MRMRRRNNLAPRMAACEPVWIHEPETLRASLTYFGVIVVFALGAAAGSVAAAQFGIHAVWVCCALLLVSFGMMFFRWNPDRRGGAI